MTVESAEVPSIAEPPVAKGPVSHRLAVSVAYSAAVFMSAMDVHIVNVALPRLSRTFHTPLASVQWTAISYALSLAVVMPSSGWIGDRLGTKRVFMASLVLFTGSSALCGLASSLSELIFFRVIQGLGGGMLLPVGIAMLFRVYPPAERARITRLLMAPIVLSPAIAPVLGGLLIEKLSWRWIFYINVPIGVAALVFSLLFLPEHREGTRGRFDPLGFVLSGAGITLVLYGVSEASLSSWTSARVLISLLVGAVALVAFVRVELRNHSPMLKLRLLHDRIFRATNVASSLNYAAFFGILFLAPVFLQEVRGQSPLTSGLTTFPEAIGVIIATQPIGRLYGKVGPRLLMSLGSAAFAIPLALLVFVGPDTNLWLVRMLMFFIGFNNAAVLLSSQAAMFTTISPADTGQASAISNSQRQVSLSIGIAVLSTVVTSLHGSRYAAFHVAFLTAAGFAVLSAVAAFALIHTKDAAATMIPYPKTAPGSGAPET